MPDDRAAGINVGGADQQKAPLLVLPRDLGEEVDSDVFRDEVPQRAVVRQAIARERADVATVWTFRRIDLDDGRVSEQELVDALPALSSFFERPAGRDGRRDGGAAVRRCGAIELSNRGVAEKRLSGTRRGG